MILLSLALWTADMTASADDDFPVLVKLTCPVCHELAEFEAFDTPRRAACSYCERDLLIPSRSQVMVLSPRIRHRTPEEIGDYGVSSQPESPFVLKADHHSSLGMPLHVPGFSARFPCANCGHSVGTRLENRAKQVNCPQCGQSLMIPALGQSGNSAPVQASPQIPSNLQNSPVKATENGGPTESRPVSPGRAPVLEDVSFRRTEPVPPPPHRTFLSGVLSFPWRRDAVIRWAYQSSGWTILLMLIVTTQEIARQYSHSMSGLILAFFALPLIWIALWSNSYAAANFLCVVELTAAGQDQIKDWPEPNWREWMLQLIYLAWIGSIPAVSGWCIARCVSPDEGQYTMIGAAVACVLYPICLMSALETNSPWTPFSVAILNSLIKHPGSWAAFYLMATATWFPLFLLFGMIGRWNPYLLAGLAGPGAAAAALILGRLFGRLAWKISGIEKTLARSRRASNC